MGMHMQSWINFCRQQFSKEAVGECWASFGLQEDVTAFVRGIRAFQDLFGRGSEGVLKPYELESSFQLYDSGPG